MATNPKPFQTTTDVAEWLKTLTDDQLCAVMVKAATAPGVSKAAKRLPMDEFLRRTGKTADSLLTELLAMS